MQAELHPTVFYSSDQSTSLQIHRKLYREKAMKPGTGSNHHSLRYSQVCQHVLKPRDTKRSHIPINICFRRADLPLKFTCEVDV